MRLFGKKNVSSLKSVDPKKSRKKIIIFIILGIIVLIGVVAFWKTGGLLNKISTEGGIFSSIAKSLPGVDKTLDGESEGRINILLLGMRGENVVGGGLLADTIMVVSIKPIEKKVSMVSIPRDFYVNVPGENYSQKINYVYFNGEEKEKNGGGIKQMKQIVSEISGQPIHYAITINFAGFEQLVDAIGGVKLSLDQSFTEPMQFHEEKVCDGDKGGVFTVKSGNYEYKKNERGKIVATYPLCYNSSEECGGIFTLPAGEQTLDGKKALCYVRSRVTSSDFDRARRQQQVLTEIKKTAFSASTLTDFSKINDILDSLGDNTKTDLEGWEMKKLFDIYRELGDGIVVNQKVLENSEEGLLYSHEGDERGYILIPRGDNYDKIKALFSSII
ncbi:MAG: LCP family protein [Candidatus Moranbacteria bacterium]|jgi:LCP family protein required for cell wall assembly|nr:LCP family protein [Candidatus Moranbacteria bacterium]